MPSASQGVEELLDRLQAEGVAAGEAEAARIVGEAQAEAARILRDARAEAERTEAEARRAAEAARKAGEEALEIAMRDAVLAMKSGLMRQFAADIRRMVTTATADPDVIRAMVLELAGQSAPAMRDGGQVLLPTEVVGLDAIRDDPSAVEGTRLTDLALGLTAEALRKGVELHAADDLTAGIRARVRDGELEIDLSDRAVADLLMRHLQPRFRAVMDGVVR